MNCPACGGESKVTGGHKTVFGYLRYRRCLDCKHTFTTAEVMGSVNPTPGRYGQFIDPQICNLCGKQYDYIWSADNELWGQFANGRSHLCAQCFTAEAEEEGVVVMFQATVKGQQR